MNSTDKLTRAKELLVEMGRDPEWLAGNPQLGLGLSMFGPMLEALANDHLARHDAAWFDEWLLTLVAVAAGFLSDGHPPVIVDTPGELWESEDHIIEGQVRVLDPGDDVPAGGRPLRVPALHRGGDRTG
jgi:hypothetical protein